VIPFQDTDLEKLYTYLRFLEIRLPERGSPAYDFDDDVQLSVLPACRKSAKEELCWRKDGPVN